MTDSSMNDFKIEKILGKGSFSTVYLVRRKEDQKNICSKICNSRKIK